MKNIVVIVLGLLFLVMIGCRKNYDCVCTQSGKVVEEYTIKAYSKKKAQKQCIQSNEFLCLGCKSCKLK